MSKICIKTCNHLGDAVCLTAVIENARLATMHSYSYSGRYSEVFDGLPIDTATPETDALIVRAEYRKAIDSAGKEIRTGDDHNASTGSLIEGMTYSLGKALGLDIPCVLRTPCLVLGEEGERAIRAYRERFGRYFVVNTNCQRNSTVKAYPYWREVVATLSGLAAVVLIGSREERDIREDLPALNRVFDLRGETSTRELIALVAGASCVVSPASSCVHIAAGFNVPSVVLTGAREPTALTAYPYAKHLTSTCKGKYNHRRGCIHFQTCPGSCENIKEINGRRYANCMAKLQQERILKAVKEVEIW